MVMSEHEDDAEEVSGQGGEDDILAGDEADDLQARLEEAEREREQFKSMAARAQADLVNYRRRAEEEKEEVQRSAKSNLLMKTLSTVDDLDRAIAMMPTDESAGWSRGHPARPAKCREHAGHGGRDKGRVPWEAL